MTTTLHTGRNASRRHPVRRQRSAVRSLLGPHLRRYWTVLAVGALLAVLQIVTKLAEPWPLGWLVDHALTPPLRGGAAIRHDVMMAVIVLCGIVGSGALLDYWSTRLLSSAGLHIANDMRGRAFLHLHRQSLRFHQQHQVGDLTARVTADVDRTQDLMVQMLANLFPNLLLVAGMFVVMIKLDLFLTLLCLAATPVLALVVHRSKMALRKASRRARKADGAVASAASESLAAIGLVQAFTLEDYQAGRFGQLSDDSLSAGVEAVRLQARFAPMVDGAGLASMLIVMWVGAMRVANKQMDLGDFLIFLAYVGSMYKPLKALSKLTAVFSKGTAAAERVADVLRTEPSIRDRPDARLAPPLSGRVRLDEVTFSYDREPVLSAVSLDIAAGETVALVGPTGAGKSTIAGLIPRLIEPQFGAVSIDGHDVRLFTLASLRSQISMVLQDTVLLRGTIRDNIACGRPGASAAAIERAAKLALVDEFASRMPDGLDTQLAERGIDLSGGQRQRIAIARAILRDTPIMILDEPTSALDGQSEQLITAALENLPQSRTTLIIAHRMSTVRRADRIAVIDHGTVVEQGSHQHLMQVGGLYSRLSDAATGRAGFLAEFPPPPSSTILVGAPR
jgi:ABC-type multidrug transport system fused ATPase/permease subunit